MKTKHIISRFLSFFIFTNIIFMEDWNPNDNFLHWNQNSNLLELLQFLSSFNKNNTIDFFKFLVSFFSILFGTKKLNKRIFFFSLPLSREMHLFSASILKSDCLNNNKLAVHKVGHDFFTFYVNVSTSEIIVPCVNFEFSRVFLSSC